MPFNELINSDKPLLVDFSAEWCGPCKAMAPVLKQVAGEIGASGRIVKIDVDANPAVAEQYQIYGVPTFILFQNGEVKWRHSGMQSVHALTSIIKQYAVEEV